MARKLLITLLIALPPALLSCGDSGDGGGSQEFGDPDSPVCKDAQARVERAGNRADDLYEARKWIAEQMKTAGEDAPYLERSLVAAGDRCAESFRKLAESMTKEQADTAGKLVAWAEQAIAEMPADDRLRRRLEAALPNLYVVMVQANPEREDLRAKSGQTRLDVDLSSLLTLPYMDDDEDITRVEELIASLADVVETAPDGTRWVPTQFKNMDEIEAVQKLAEDRKRDFEEKKKNDPLFAKALVALDETKASLAQTLNTSYKWVGRYHYPYMFIIERDKAWNETDVANQKAEQLGQLISAFKNEYGPLVDLPEFTDPLPVVVFKRHTAYQKIAAKVVGVGALGHFEPSTGRLMVSDQAERDTLFHEATHQLVAYYTEDALADYWNRSYWFQEGVAEYFGATTISLDPETKKWNYELGVLQQGRLDYWRGNEHKAYDLWDLIGLSFGDRQKNRAEGNQDKNLMVYSQGWLLIYFLYNFKVDDEGLVVLGRQGQGKYRDNFRRYLVGELGGKSGREFFLQCMDMWKDGKVDQTKFDALDEEFTAYYEWLNKKTAMKYHVKDLKPVPWNEVVNIRGKKIGDKEDDMLYPPPPPEDE